MQDRLPTWFRQELPGREVYALSSLINGLRLDTVCSRACCPNLNRCFKDGHLTFLILGPECTRACRFCAVKKSRVPRAPDPGEPGRIAAAVKELSLRFVVVTSVTRDDLEDGGAAVFCRTVDELRKLDAPPGIELLIPDFSGRAGSIKSIVESAPEVIGHNLETVSSLYAELKPDSDYRRSLEVLRLIKKINPSQVTKSGLMLGFGETPEQVAGALEDLRECGCDILTLGQYLAPSKAHYPVREFITPETFSGYKKTALSLGFRGVSCGPLVRSSSDAGQLYGELTNA